MRTNNELIEKIQRQHWAALETYIHTYMQVAGYGIDDIILCEERVNPGDMSKIQMRYWCEPKPPGWTHKTAGDSGNE